MVTGYCAQQGRYIIKINLIRNIDYFITQVLGSAHTFPGRYRRSLCHLSDLAYQILLVHGMHRPRYASLRM